MELETTDANDYQCRLAGQRPTTALGKWCDWFSDIGFAPAAEMYLERMVERGHPIFSTGTYTVVVRNGVYESKRIKVKMVKGSHPEAIAQ